MAANAHSASVVKTEEEWKQELSAEEYAVLREKDTERPNTGKLNKFYPAGGYFACRGCKNPLYSAQSKFDSGCGWPAFDKCFDESIVTEVYEYRGGSWRSCLWLCSWWSWFWSSSSSVKSRRSDGGEAGWASENSLYTWVSTVVLIILFIRLMMWI